MAEGSAVTISYAEIAIYGLVNKLGHLLVQEVQLLGGCVVDGEEAMETTQSCDQSIVVYAVLAVLSEAHNLLRSLLHAKEESQMEEAWDLAYEMEDSIDLFLFYVKSPSTSTEAQDAVTAVFTSQMQTIVARIRSLSSSSSGPAGGFMLAQFEVSYGGGAVYDLVLKLGRMLVAELALLGGVDGEDDMAETDQTTTQSSVQGMLVSAVLAVLSVAMNLLVATGESAEEEEAVTTVATEMWDYVETFVFDMKKSSSREEQDDVTSQFMSQMQASVASTSSGALFTFSVDLFPSSTVHIELERQTACLVEMVAAETDANLKAFCVMGSAGMASEVRRRLEDKFECTANVTLSETFAAGSKQDLAELLRCLLVQVMSASKEETEVIMPGVIEFMEAETLSDMLQKYLEDKRYLIVIEDVWTMEAPECIRCTLSNNNLGSRIVLITKDETVASACVAMTR